MLSASGRVGIFDFEDAKGAKVKSNRWQRVTVSVAGSSMATYVDGELCYASDHLPGGKDDRYSLSTQGLQLFGSSKPQLMPGGILVRYVSPSLLSSDTNRFLQVRSEALDAEAVRASTFNNRIVDVQGLRSRAQRRRLMAKLSLAPLRLQRQAQPIWTEGSFLAEFGDAFLEGTGLEGGNILSALKIAELTLSGISTSGLASGPATEAIAQVATTMRDSVGIFRRVAAAQRGDGLARLLKTLAKDLLALLPGRALMVPAGWRVPTDNDEFIQYDIVVVVEATTAMGLSNDALLLSRQTPPGTVSIGWLCAMVAKAVAYTPCHPSARQS